MADNKLLIRRAVARLIDAVVLVAISVAVGSATNFGVGWFIATAIGTYTYFVLGDSLASRTIGKATVGLRVVDEHQRRPSAVAAAKREAFVLLGAIPFAGPLLALATAIAIVMAERSGQRGFHDRLGRTLVARYHAHAETAR